MAFTLGQINALSSAKTGRSFEEGRAQEHDRTPLRIYSEENGIDALVTAPQRSRKFGDIVVEAYDLGPLVVNLAAGGGVLGSAEHAVESRIDVVAGVVFEEDGEGDLGMSRGW